MKSPFLLLTDIFIIYTIFFSPVCISFSILFLDFSVSLLHSNRPTNINSVDCKSNQLTEDIKWKIKKKQSKEKFELHLPRNENEYT